VERQLRNLEAELEDELETSDTAKASLAQILEEKMKLEEELKARVPADAEKALRQRLSAAESEEQASAAAAAQAGQRLALLQQELGEEKGRSLRAEEAAREEASACASLRGVLAEGEATNRFQKLQEEHATYRRGATVACLGLPSWRESLWRFCRVSRALRLRQ